MCRDTRARRQRGRRRVIGSRGVAPSWGGSSTREPLTGVRVAAGGWNCAALGAAVGRGSEVVVAGGAEVGCRWRAAAGPSSAGEGEGEEEAEEPVGDDEDAEVGGGEAGAGADVVSGGEAPAAGPEERRQRQVG